MDSRLKYRFKEFTYAKYKYHLVLFLFLILFLFPGTIFFAN